MTTIPHTPAGMTFAAPVPEAYAEVLTPGALSFVAELHRRFDARRRELLAAREERQARLDAGELPDFLPETEGVRAGDWKISPLPADLQDRRVEITGPVDRKMIINALNSGARMFMADFEDASSPVWENMLDGQLNLRDAVRGTISLEQGARATAWLSSPPCCLSARAACTSPKSTSRWTARR